MTSPDAYVASFPRGRGADGMAPCAYVEAWLLDGGFVTFGGIPPEGDRAWRIMIWLAIAAEAARRAREEEAGTVLPPAWVTGGDELP